MSTINNKSSQTRKIPWLLEKTVRSYDPNLAKIFLPWSLKHSRYLKSFINLRRIYKQTEKKRELMNEAGIRVPPFLIMSITSKCNLKCSGCYAAAAGNINSNNNQQLSWNDWYNIIKEASELGVFCFILAGGEPFLYPGLIDLCNNFKDRFFLILTNGTTIKQHDFDKIKKLGNVGIIVSIEGSEELTDARRGPGVHKKSLVTLERLNQHGVLTGISVTITRLNYRYWMQQHNIESLMDKGIKIGVFIEYIPLTPANNGDKPNCTNLFISALGPSQDMVEKIYDQLMKTNNDHGLILTPMERTEFRQYMLLNRDTKPIYIIHSPGDEEYFGGCVSAGRGFAHVTPNGDLTPCPVSNIATHNLVKDSLCDGLASPLFKRICENEHLLETDGFPCALFAHPEEVDELAKSVGAYRTNIRK